MGQAKAEMRKMFTTMFQRGKTAGQSCFKEVLHGSGLISTPGVDEPEQPGMNAGPAQMSGEQAAGRRLRKNKAGRDHQIATRYHHLKEADRAVQ